MVVSSTLARLRFEIWKYCAVEVEVSIGSSGCCGQSEVCCGPHYPRGAGVRWLGWADTISCLSPQHAEEATSLPKKAGAVIA